MAHANPRAHDFPIQPGFLIALVLSGAIGFALGQYSPTFGAANSSYQPPIEDWHGNVMRSHWTK